MLVDGDVDVCTVHFYFNVNNNYKANLINFRTKL